jgi:hypothetical protein
MFPMMKYDVARIAGKDAGILLTALCQLISARIQRLNEVMV